MKLQLTFAYQIPLLLIVALICCRFLEVPLQILHVECSLSSICTTLEANEYVKHTDNTLENYWDVSSITSNIIGLFAYPLKNLAWNNFVHVVIG